jgi:conjugative relaxase-like TrwC/TraI family protein
MLSYAKIKSAGPAAAYFAKYYASDEDRQNGEPPGRWEGTAAAMLGLTGEVRREELERVLRGEHPSLDQFLGKIDKNHVAGHDLTFSAPKSVSTVWAVADRDLRARIEAAHERAVSAGIAYMREHGIHCRMGKAGRELAKAEPIVARFQHSTSRANDPQLHTHTVVVNRALGPSGDWRGVEVDLRALHAAGAAYRAHLAHELKNMGYGIERTREKGEFEISGVPSELMKRWSTRRGDVLAELNEMERSGAEASAKAAAVSRRHKENPDRQENFSRWSDEAESHGFNSQSAVELSRGSREKEAGASQKEDEPERVPALTDEEIVTRALGNRVAVDAETIRREVLRESVGRQTVSEGLARAERILASLERVERDDARGRKIERFTTLEMLERERSIVRDSAALAGAQHHEISAQAVDAQIERSGLSGQQADMVRHLTDARGLANVQGWAGTGKTYTVKQVAELYRAAGYEVRGCAVAGRAAQELKDAGIADSTTIARLRIELDAGRIEFHRNTVLVIDEAGMMGSRDAADLYRRAAEAGSKIIQIGDTRQLSPVEAGAPFRDCLRVHGGIELSEVRRQADDQDKEVAKAVREQRPEEARSLMQGRDQWHIAEKVSDAIRDMARAYAAERAEGRDALLVASLRRDVERLNIEARSELRRHGLLRGDDVSIATGKGELRLAAGDRVMFTERVDQLRAVNGTRAEVIEARPDALRLRFQDGREREIKLWRPEELEAVRERLAAKEAHVQSLTEQRDRVRDYALDAADGSKDVRDSWKLLEEVKRELDAAKRELRSAREEAGRSQSESTAARSLVYGHASTIHKSQGATVKGWEQGGGTVHALLRDHHLTDSNAAYVALSRNTGKAHAYVPKAEEAGALERLREAARTESLQDYRKSSSERVAPQPEAPTSRATSPSVDQTSRRSPDELTHFEVGGRRIEVDASREMETGAHRLVLVDVRDIDKRWRATDPGLHVRASDPTSGSASKLERARTWLREGEVGVPPVVGVDSSGKVSIVDGRHRLAALLEAGATKIPVQMSPRSLEAAQRHGIALASKEPVPQRDAPAVNLVKETKQQSPIGDRGSSDQAKPVYLSSGMARELAVLQRSSDPRERMLAQSTDAWLSHAHALREAALRYGDQRGKLEADREAVTAIRAFHEAKSEIAAEKTSQNSGQNASAENFAARQEAAHGYKKPERHQTLATSPAPRQEPPSQSGHEHGWHWR